MRAVCLRFESIFNYRFRSDVRAHRFLQRRRLVKKKKEKERAQLVGNIAFFSPGGRYAHLGTYRVEVVFRG